MNGKTNNIWSKALTIKKDYYVFNWLNKSVPVLMGIFIFFNPFPHTTTIKEICFYLSVIIVLFLISLKKINVSFNTPFLIPFGLFVCWAFIGLYFALDKKNSIHDFYSHLIRYIMLYYILTNFFRSKNRLILLSWIIVISSTIFNLGNIINFYFVLENSLSSRLGVHSIVQAPVNVIGVITVFAAIISINNFLNETKLYRKIILIICFIILLLTIVLSQTKSSFIPLSLAVIIIFIDNKKALVAFVGIIIILVSLFPFKNRLFNYQNLLVKFRVGIHYHTFEVIKDYPIMGIGFGMETFKNSLDLKTYHKRVPEKYRENFIYNDPHNMFMDIAVRLGIVGFALFLCVIFVFFKMCWDIITNRKDNFVINWGRCLASGFFSFLIIGFFHPVFSHMPETVLCTMFSMLTIVYRFNDKPFSHDVV